MNIIQQVLSNYMVLMPMIIVMFYSTTKIADFKFKRAVGDFEINDALLIRRSGLYLGIAIGIYAIFQNIFIEREFFESVMYQISEMFLLMLFMFTSLKVADKVIFNSVKNDDEVINNNISLAISEASILIGTGLVAYGSILGTGPLWTTIMFFVIGQLAFISLTWLYEKYELKFKNEDLRSEIINGNFAKSIKLSSFILFAAIAMKTGIAGDYTNVVNDLIYLATVFAFLLVSLALYIVLIEKTVLNKFLKEECLGCSMMKFVLRVSYVATSSMIIVNTI